MTIEAVKVPADIQVEEKIIGPIGLRQVFILIGTGGLSYVFWSFAKNAGANTTFQILSWFPFAVGGAFAFVRIHDVTLMRLLLLSIEKMKKPARRLFGPRSGITITIRTNGPDRKKKLEKKDPEAVAKIQELSAILDTKMNEAAEEEAKVLPGERAQKVAIEEEGNIAAPKVDNRPSIDGISPPSTV